MTFFVFRLLSHFPLPFITWMFSQWIRAMKFQLVAAVSAVLCALAAAAPRVDPKECEGKKDTWPEVGVMGILSKALSGE